MEPIEEPESRAETCLLYDGPPEKRRCEECSGLGTGPNPERCDHAGYRYRDLKNLTK